MPACVRPTENGETVTGPGLSRAMLHHDAEPSLQLFKTNARCYRGLGLGLADVKRSLASLCGKLELLSRASGIPIEEFMGGEDSEN